MFVLFGVLCFFGNIRSGNVFSDLGKKVRRNSPNLLLSYDKGTTYAVFVNELSLPKDKSNASIGGFIASFKVV